MTDDGGGSLVLSPASPGALGVPTAGTGHGIIGMRERANLCGGDFIAGALPGGGFEVNATLPLLGAAATRRRRCRDRRAAVTISVAVADDQALVRVGFCGIIAATPGFSVVGEAANGAEAVEVARAVKPDVILMDVRMPVWTASRRPARSRPRRRPRASG